MPYVQKRSKSSTSTQYKVVTTDQQTGQTKMQTNTNPSHTKILSVGKILSFSSEYDHLTNTDVQDITRAPTQQLVFEENYVPHTDSKRCN